MVLRSWRGFRTGGVRVRAGLDVVHVTTAHSALDVRIFYREARTAQKAGLEVAVVGPHHALTVVDGVRIIPVKKWNRRWVRRVLTPLSAFWAVRRLRPTIVHFHDPEFLPWAALLKVLGMKVAWDVHEYYSEVQTDLMRPGPLRSFKRSAIRFFVERGPADFFDRTVFPTDSLRAAVRVSPRTVSCVNLLSIEEFPDDGKSIDKQFDLVFMGAMSPFRAGPFMDVLRHLVAARPDARALLLGVPNGTREWMLKNAPSIEVANAMNFMARVPHAEVPRILRAARIGFNYHPMYPRFEVAIPVKVYEYMACGLPVVCSAFPELQSQFHSDEMCFVDGDDPLEYARAVLELLRDRERLEFIGKRGQVAVLNRVNWEAREAAKLISMYRDLLGGVGA